MRVRKWKSRDIPRGKELGFAAEEERAVMSGGFEAVGDPRGELSSSVQRPVSQAAGRRAATRPSAEKQRAAACVSGTHTEAGDAARTHAHLSLNTAQ